MVFTHTQGLDPVLCYTTPLGYGNALKGQHIYVIQPRWGMEMP
jgi:hypothetical protein